MNEMSDMNDENDETSTASTGRRSPRRWLLWGVLAVIAVVALGYGAIFFYTEVLNDPEDELTTDDLAEALQGPSTTVAVTLDETATDDDRTATTTAAPDPTGSTSPAPTTADDASGGTGDATAADGTWRATGASELGYRVKEILFGVDTEGVGRTNQVTGALTIDGTDVTDASFEVDVASIESDDGRRDNQFRGRIMTTDEFPTATFTLTEPIALGSIPAPGEQITATATGDLTLRGVTNPVTFDVTAQLENDRIGVLGAIPVVFADYQIANPSTSGIRTEDEGLLEFVLVFERDG